MHDDGLALPDWVGGLIVSAGSALAGGVASRISGEGSAQREAMDRSLTLQFQAQQIEAQRSSQAMELAMLGLGALVVITVLR